MGRICERSRRAGTRANATASPMASPASSRVDGESTKKQLTMKASADTSLTRGSSRWTVESTE